MLIVENDLLNHLRALEVELHRPAARSNPGRLDGLLHDAFVEIGRSGQSYSKADILKGLDSERFDGTVWSQDFSIAVLAEGVALLTYKTARLERGGDGSRYTLRASLWQRTVSGWRMRFHQGTPTDAFAINTA